MKCSVVELPGFTATDMAILNGASYSEESIFTKQVVYFYTTEHWESIFKW